MIVTANIQNKPTSAQHSYRSLRWLILLIFLFGYLSTFTHFEALSLEYLVLTIISFLSCCFLLSRLDQPVQNALPFWLIFFIFIIAYYIKFYWIVWNPESSKHLWFLHLQYISESPDILLIGYSTFTYAFAAFCFLGWWLLASKTGTQAQMKASIDYAGTITNLLWIIPFFMAASFLVMQRFAIGVMGRESSPLPFRLSGWIYYIRIVLIPMLLLLLFWCSDQARKNKYITIVCVLIIIHGLSDILLRSTRGSIFWLAFDLTVLFVISGRISRKRLYLIALLVLFTILIWPIITAYRGIRIDYPDAPIGSALYKLSDMESSFGEMFAQGFQSLFLRVPGIDSLLPIIASNIEPSGITNLFSYQIERTFTFDVLGFNISAIQGCSPSLLGWFYLVGGRYLVIIGTVVFTLSTWYGWQLLPKLKLKTLPIIQTFFIVIIFGIATDAPLYNLDLILLTFTGSAAFCEVVTSGHFRLSSMLRPIRAKQRGLISPRRPIFQTGASQAEQKEWKKF